MSFLILCCIVVGTEINERFSVWKPRDDPTQGIPGDLPSDGDGC